MTKNGVHAGDHTIAYSGSKPVYFKGEKAKGLTKQPLKIVTKNPRHKLADTSRLNYAKTYTVEYNVKVWFIGNVDKDFMWHLITDFNQVHPPLETQGLTAPSPYQDGETAYADGGMDNQDYSTPTPNYGSGTSSWTPSAFSDQQAQSWAPASVSDQQSAPWPSSTVSDQQTWSQQQEYHQDSYDQPQPSYEASTEKYPSHHSSSSRGDRRPSRSRGKGKGVQRDNRPEDDIAEGPEEQEHSHDKSSYEDAAEPEYESQHDAYNEARHDEGNYRYGPEAAEHSEEE